jgi:hypothetical protein
MSHFSVTVVIPKDYISVAFDDPDAVSEIEGFTAQLLAPYDENGTWFAHGSRWDWWVIGGRWRAHWKALPGRPFWLLDYHPVWGEQVPAPELHGDIIRKGDVDWEGMAHDRYVRNLNYWLKVQQQVESGQSSFMWDQQILTEYPSAEEYARAEDTGYLGTYALLTTEQWYENERMGWWGAATESDGLAEEFDYIARINCLDDEDILVCVDCHV